MTIITLVAAALTVAHAADLHAPDPNRTPGVLCTKTDPDFERYDYPEKIARCARNVSRSDKQTVAENYGGIPESRWERYEFDHLIPLCAGGSDDLRNLWPQPIGQARRKDQVEVEVCVAMKAGRMTQKQAVQRILGWFKQNQATILDESPTRAFLCHSERTLVEIPGAAFRIRGRVSANGNVSNVRWSIGETVLAEAPGPLSPARFRPRTPLLAGHAKYVVQNEVGDSLHLFLPADAVAGFGQAYVRVAFEGTYPRLDRVVCD